MAIIKAKTSDAKFTKEGKKLITYVIGAIVILIVLSVLKFWFIVEPGEIGLIKQLGNLQEKTYDEGMHFKVPILQSSVIMSIKEVKEEITTRSASKDLQDVTTAIAINYSLQKGKVLDLYRNVGNNNIIKSVLVAPAIQESVKSATAKYTASELITKRSEVKDEIEKALSNKLEKRGIAISSVNITDFKFSDSFNQAIEQKVKAEQDAQRAENDLKRVEFETQQTIKKAQAEAEKIKIQAQAITSQGGKEYVQLQAIEKWDGKLPQYSLGENNMMMLPVNGN